MTMQVFKRIFLIVAVMVVGLMLLGMVQPSSATTEPPPEEVRIECEAADPVCEFRLKLPGDDINLDILRVGPLPSVAPPDIRVQPRPRATVTVPGPVRTVPGPIQTVRPPPVILRPPPRTVTPPRVTVTEQAPIGPSQAPELPDRITVTDGAPQITATSRPRPTVTVTDEATETETETFSVPGGQAAPPDGILTPTPKTDKPGAPDIVFPKVELSTPEAVGIGLFALGILIALVLGAMYLGYILGWKDCDQENATFLTSLRDQLAVKKK